MDKDNSKCGHPDCECPPASASEYCGPECQEQETSSQPEAEGPQKMLSGQTYDKPACQCGHLDCDAAEPEPQI